MGAYADLTGQRFTRLVGLRRIGRRNNNTIWLFACDCGNTREMLLANVTAGRSQSCGCLQNERRIESHTKHGRARKGAVTTEFIVWYGAKDRCENPSNDAYPNYGGRGITMDPRWANDFAAFWRDMGPRPDGRTLDRIDNDGPYSPENCRWATIMEQASNKRTNVYDVVDGKKMHLAAIARLRGVSAQRLSVVTRELGIGVNEAADVLLARRQARAVR